MLLIHCPKWVVLLKKRAFPRSWQIDYDSKLSTSHLRRSSGQRRRSSAIPDSHPIKCFVSCFRGDLTAIRRYVCIIVSLELQALCLPTQPGPVVWQQQQHRCCRAAARIVCVYARAGSYCCRLVLVFALVFFSLFFSPLFSLSFSLFFMWMFFLQTNHTLVCTPGFWLIWYVIHGTRYMPGWAHARQETTPQSQCSHAPPVLNTMLPRARVPADCIGCLSVLDLNWSAQGRDFIRPFWVNFHSIYLCK